MSEQSEFDLNQYVRKSRQKPFVIYEMSEQTEFEQSQDVPEGQEPRVVYVERDRGLFASVRRLRQRTGEAGRRWVAESVDAPLPTSWQERVPDMWDSGRGRWVIAAVAMAVLLVWVLVVVQAMAG